MGDVTQGNLVLSTQLIMQIGHGKDFKSGGFEH